MKKIAIFFLVCTMMLTMSACGNSQETELYNKYSELIGYLENNDYQNAFGYINNLQYQAKQNADAEADDAPLMAILEGKFYDPDSDYTMTFKPDYTVEYDGTSKIFKFDSVTDSLEKLKNNEDFYIMATTDGANYQGINLVYNDRLNSYTVETNDNSGNWHRLVKEGSLEKIDLSLDNYKDYFEITDSMTFSKNSFGEIETVFIGKIIKLKDGIAFYKGDGAVEYKGISREIKVLSFDTDSRTFELGEETENSKEWNHEPYEETVSLWEETSNEEPYEFLYFGGRLTSHSINEEEMTVNYEDIEITRIEGTIYLVK